MGIVVFIIGAALAVGLVAIVKAVDTSIDKLRGRVGALEAAGDEDRRDSRTFSSAISADYRELATNAERDHARLEILQRDVNQMRGPLNDAVSDSCYAVERVGDLLSKAETQGEISEDDGKRLEALETKARKQAAKIERLEAKARRRRG